MRRNIECFSQKHDVAISPRSRQTTVASRRYVIRRTIENPEASMGAVMIKCPDTGRDIPTGMIADRESFKATPVFFARVLCPLCGKQHEWFAQQAWVAVDPRAATRARHAVAA
jgi:hypothetical protein